MSRRFVTLGASLALFAAAPAAADSYAQLGYTTADAYDRVVYTGIGNRNSTLATDSQAGRGIPFAIDLGPVTGRSSAADGALHVAGAVDLAAVSDPGAPRSANVDAYAEWTDVLHFTVPPGFTGYASFILNVTGAVAATPATGYGASDPFAGSSAVLEVHGNAYDGSTAYFVATGMGEISYHNFVARYPVGDPDYVGDADHFDPVRGVYFTDNPPEDIEGRDFVEWAGTVDADGNATPPHPATNLHLSALTGDYLVRIPVVYGLDTTLAVQTWCSAFAGAVVGDTASASCDLGHSVYWGGITGLRSTDGHALAGWSVASDSGFDYTRSFFGTLPPTAAVPEPATWVLLIAGFGLTGAAMRRQSRLPHVLSPAATLNGEISIDPALKRSASISLPTTRSVAISTMAAT